MSRLSSWMRVAIVDLRGDLRRLGYNRINSLILNGQCRNAQNLYRQLRSVSATPNSDSFGEACPAP